MRRVDIPKLFILIDTILIIIGVYLFLQAVDFANKNLATEAILLIGASMALLFFAITPWISIFLVRLRILKDVPDALSGGSDEQFGAGIALGLLVFGSLGLIAQGTQQSFLLFPTQTVFSQVVSILNLEFWQLSFINIAVPFGEELFFALFLPSILFGITLPTLKKLRLPFPVFLTSINVFFLVSMFFSFFHIFRQSDPTALFGSILFRVLTLSLIYSDQFLDIVKFLNVSLGVTIGLHVSNNTTETTTFLHMIQVLLTGDGVSSITIIFGLLFLSVFIISFIQLGVLLIKIITGKKIANNKRAIF